MQRLPLICLCLAGLSWSGCPGTPFDNSCLSVEECVEKGHSCPGGQDLFCNGDTGFPGVCDCRASGTGGAGGSGGGGTGGSGGMPAACADPSENPFVVIEDEDFDDADWQHTETHEEGSIISTEPTGQEGVDGVDGSPYRLMTHEITNPSLGAPDCAADDCSFTMIVSHQYVAAGGTYWPAMDGAIDYIDYSESRIITEASFNGAAVGWTFVIWQDEGRYRVPGTAFNNVMWSSESLCGLTPQDFGSEGPNFVDGGPMTFGYSRSNTNTSPGVLQRNVHGIDNFRVVIVKK